MPRVIEQVQEHPQASTVRHWLTRGDQAYERAAVAMRAMADDGLSHRQIAEQVGCDRTRVDRLLRALGRVTQDRTFSQAYAEVNNPETASQRDLRAAIRAAADNPDEIVASLEPEQLDALHGAVVNRRMEERGERPERAEPTPVEVIARFILKTEELRRVLRARARSREVREVTRDQLVPTLADLLEASQRIAAAAPPRENGEE